jgi:uncharacterized protein YbcC (UPF0753/DUF2309 family)
MSTNPAIEERIDAAAETVGPAWPLHSFVTANPLAGFEDRPFHEAVAEAERVRGGDGYPSADVFRRAREAGRIDPDVLEAELAAHGYDADPETLLDRMAAAESPDAGGPTTSPTERVDALLTKWLSAFLDQGRAEWSMPAREEGFYAAFRAVAPHDGGIPDAKSIADLPDDPVDAIRDCLDEVPVDRWAALFEDHLAALPGWTAFVAQRAADGDDWQSASPITLPGYLAVRLVLADRLDAPIEPDGGRADPPTDDTVPLPECWLTAWETTYRDGLVDAIAGESAALSDAPGGDRPDAQLVFCIDTRSEVIRRHVEAAGNYETHGYAGFFGIPMRYDGYDSDVAVDACPPILDAQHRIRDRPARRTGSVRDAHDRRRGALETGKRVIESLTSNAATAFSFVESAGAGYGAALAARTLLPARLYDLRRAVSERLPAVHAFCDPTVDYNPDAVHALREGLTLDEKVEYAATAFDLMGWERFARLVVFTGHASETTNNPFASSLDCGACAGNPGGPNARVLAAICNDEAVRAELRDRGIDVPADTVFLAGEHNTTTDEVELYAADVPESHAADLERLRADLDAARAGAAAERVGDDPADASARREAERRAADWAEPRPEWGLAGNAAFVVGPRGLTDGLDLDARSFLHSYDWSTDPDGDALNAILTGPMVVTQWINAQYYFSTVDTAAYGSGSKVTQNPVGNVGVYQGNGGDLLTGLPTQSLKATDDEPYHQPLRLSTVIHAPVDRVTDVLAAHDHLTTLLDNGWLSLTVVDPTREHRAFHYDGDLCWEPAADGGAERPAPAPSAADD